MYLDLRRNLNGQQRKVNSETSVTCATSLKGESSPRFCMCIGVIGGMDEKGKRVIS